jgi:hypothetical protein
VAMSSSCELTYLRAYVAAPANGPAANESRLRPHHDAQKSTITISFLVTISSNFFSLVSSTVAIKLSARTGANHSMTLVTR